MSNNNSHLSHFMLNPIKAIVFSFLFTIILGSVLLTLPISSSTNVFTDPINALFTATSATCVTGLVIFDTATHWSAFGEAVILMLIQIGGLGIVTISAFFTASIGKKLGFKAMQITQESISFNNVSGMSNAIRKIVSFAFFFETLGALILCFVFVPEYGLQGIWISIFLSISSFCNAGFDILGFQKKFASLSGYYNDPIVLFVIAALIVIGGLGFLVWYDIYNYKKVKKLLLHTKIVLIMTGLLIIFGTIIFCILEWNNQKTIGNFTGAEKIMNGFFHSVSTRTAGFNTFDMASMGGLSRFFSILLMFIGASPGSTGGGIKVTTVSIIIMTVISVVKGENETILLKRKVNKKIVYKSIAIFTMSLTIVFSVFCILYFMMNPTQNGVKPINILFESVSAFSTVGLSTGIIEFFGSFEKLLFIITMFVGRVGSLSLLTFFLKNDENKKNKINPEGIIIV